MASKSKRSPLVVIRRRGDFLALARTGQRIKPSDWLLLNFLPRNRGDLDPVMRCGWTTPKNVGSAVIRNRLKRWCRVYFRSLTGSGRELPVDVNVVFRPMKDDFYRKLSYEAFAKILDKGWTQLERRLR